MFLYLVHRSKMLCLQIGNLLIVGLKYSNMRASKNLNEKQCLSMDSDLIYFHKIINCFENYYA